MDTSQATIVSGWATLGQFIASVAMVWVTIRLAGLARQQGENMQLQTQKMQTQINLNLYDKRFKIYESLVILTDSVLKVSLPKMGDDGDFKRFSDEIGESLRRFWITSKERDFLLDDVLNSYIDSIVGRVDKVRKVNVKGKLEIFSEKVAANYTRYDSQVQYLAWLCEALKEKDQFIIDLQNEIHEKFKTYLDFKKI